MFIFYMYFKLKSEPDFRFDFQIQFRLDFQIVSQLELRCSCSIVLRNRFLFLFLFLVSTSIQLFDVVLSVHTSIPNCAFRLHVKLNSDFDSGFEFKVQLRIWFSTCILNIITMLVFELSSQYNFDSALASNVKFDSDNGFGFSFYSLTPNLVFWLNFKFDSECWCSI